MDEADPAWQPTAWRTRLRLVAHFGCACVMMDDDERILGEATNWLLALADHPDDTDMAAHFRDWLSADARHWDTWQQLGQSYEMIGDAGTAGATSAMAAEPARLPMGRCARRRRATPSLILKRRPMIASAVAAALVAVWLVPSALLAIQADHRTGTGELETVALADGSTAQLGPQSAIRVTFTQGERRIHLLQGEALFQVRPNPARPFRVAAGSVTTTVLGTGFDVRRLAAATHVGVQHGRVRVDDSASGARSTFLSAGDEVRIDKGGRAQVDHVAPALIASWALAEVNARDRTVAEVIDDIRPWYRGRIILMDDAIAARRVNGVYNPRNPLQAVHSLVGPIGGSVTRITPWLIIVG
ncbi:FecR domain-containing protein [Sphingobium sp. WCS2017Hpa-17]|uniref:FecR family protein n=1 Tax=Sphingobium sp. WCS2017Hpa-17 TaxID=3073638 RepID=UPI0028890843|nr:FecR domain-containing protein [Sphingobium sp. WCS2017Hpa-17]